jgi:hypothetical protein
MNDVWLIKTDSSGKKLWDSTYGGRQEDCGNSVRQTADGGYVIVGYTASSGAGSSDVWLIKTDARGRRVWDRTFGGPDADDGYSVEQTTDGGYVVAGWTASYGAGSHDVWLIKTDASGKEAWNKSFGNLGLDESYSVRQTTDGGYIVAGTATPPDAGSRDVWLIRTDKAGKKVWSETFGGVHDDAGNSVLQTRDGGYVVTGFTYSYGAGGADVWLLKVDASGKKVWDRTFGGTRDDDGYSVEPTSDGGLVIAGYTTSLVSPDENALLIKTDADGN